MQLRSGFVFIQPGTLRIYRGEYYWKPLGGSTVRQNFVYQLDRRGTVHRYNNDADFEKRWADGSKLSSIQVDGFLRSIYGSNIDWNYGPYPLNSVDDGANWKRAGHVDAPIANIGRTDTSSPTPDSADDDDVDTPVSPVSDKSPTDPVDDSSKPGGQDPPETRVTTQGDTQTSGFDLGIEQYEFNRAAYPGTNPWDWLGGSGQGTFGQAEGAATAAKSQQAIAQLQAQTAWRVEQSRAQAVRDVASLQSEATRYAADVSERLGRYKTDREAEVNRYRIDVEAETGRYRTETEEKTTTERTGVTEKLGEQTLKLQEDLAALERDLKQQIAVLETDTSLETTLIGSGIGGLLVAAVSKLVDWLSGKRQIESTEGIAAQQRATSERIAVVSNLAELMTINAKVKSLLASAGLSDAQRDSILQKLSLELEKLDAEAYRAVQEGKYTAAQLAKFVALLPTALLQATTDLKASAAQHLRLRAGIIKDVADIRSHWMKVRNDLVKSGNPLHDIMSAFRFALEGVVGGGIDYEQETHRLLQGLFVGRGNPIAELNPSTSEEMSATLGEVLDYFEEIDRGALEEHFETSPFDGLPMTGSPQLAEPRRVGNVEVKFLDPDYYTSEELAEIMRLDPSTYAQIIMRDTESGWD